MSRSKYLFSKIGFALSTVIAVIIVNFFLFRILPGDPVRLILNAPRMTSEAQQRVRQQFGLDKPVLFDSERFQKGDFWGAFDTQFTAYITNLLKGNLGVSFVSREEVGRLLMERTWRTVALLIAGEILAIVLGISIGLIAAWRHGGLFDVSSMVIGIFGWALPTFFLSIILLILARGILPSGGMVTPGLKPSDGLKYWQDVGRHVILPTIAMVIIFTSQYMMVMRASVMEVLSEDYILTAKAKGLNSVQILKSHALKNAMLPMITIITIRLGFVIAGAIQVETVFSWPGIGRLIYDSVAKNDYPVLQGAFLLIAVSVIMANLMADLLYSVVDPRVERE